MFIYYVFKFIRSIFCTTLFLFLFSFLLNSENRILMICGELSGEKIGQWYLKKLRKEEQDLKCYALGGSLLRTEDVVLVGDYKNYSVRLLDIFDLFRKIPRIWDLESELLTLIKNENINEIVLVDFPIFNILFARFIKRNFKNLKITYIAPPELWVWGDFGVSYLLKKYCDRIIVIYPFEVDYYRKLGLEVEFIGYPFLEELKNIQVPIEKKEQSIALMVGSRDSEINVTIPFFSEFIKKFKKRYPQVKFIIPLAESIPLARIEELINKNGIDSYVEIVQINKDERISHCFCAITKPGTSTLTLALLNVPAVTIVRVSYFYYLFFRYLSPLKYVSLPNTILDKEIFKELIQGQCNLDNLFLYISDLYDCFLNRKEEYMSIMAKLNDCYLLLKN